MLKLNIIPGLLILFLIVPDIVQAATITTAAKQENTKTSEEVVLEDDQAMPDDKMYKRNKRISFYQESNVDTKFNQLMEKKLKAPKMRSRLSKLAFFRGKRDDHVILGEKWICSPIEEVWN